MSRPAGWARRSAAASTTTAATCRFRRGRALPEGRHAVRCNPRVAGNQRCVLAECLSDQNTIKRVSVEDRKAACGHGMAGLDGQPVEPGLPCGVFYIGRQRGELGAPRSFEFDFVPADGADPNLLLKIAQSVVRSCRKLV